MPSEGTFTGSCPVHAPHSDPRANGQSTVESGAGASPVTPWQRRANRIAPVIRILDLPGYWVGKAAAWLIVPLVGVLVYEVFVRYVLGAPTIWAYDLTYMFYGTIFMLGAAYALGRDAHVRADFLYQYLSLRWQASIDLTFYLVLFFPAIGVFTWLTTGYALHSWEIGERIPSSPWMPIIYPFKTIMPITGLLLLIQGLAESLKSFYCIVTDSYYRDRQAQLEHLPE